MSHLLLQFDYAVLKFFNVIAGKPYIDMFWLGLTDLHKINAIRFAVVPLLILWVIYRYRALALKAVVVLAVAVSLADLFAYRVVKPFVQRQRPAQNLEISSWHRPVGDAHGLSFPSNHASNSFAGAFVLGHFFRRGRKYFYTFAVLVGLSRAGLGVHYPSDILGGALLGTLCGWIAVSAYRGIVSRWDGDSSADKPTSGRSETH